MVQPRINCQLKENGIAMHQTVNLQTTPKQASNAMRVQIQKWCPNHRNQARKPSSAVPKIYKLKFQGHVPRPNPESQTGQIAARHGGAIALS
jgi:hypothetical protein